MTTLLNAIKDALAANDAEAVTKAKAKARKHLDKHPMAACVLGADDLQLING